MFDFFWDDLGGEADGYYLPAPVCGVKPIIVMDSRLKKSKRAGGIFIQLLGVHASFNGWPVPHVVVITKGGQVEKRAC